MPLNRARFRSVASAWESPRPVLSLLALVASIFVVTFDAAAQAPVPGGATGSRKSSDDAKPAPRGASEVPTRAEIERLLLARKFAEAQDAIERRLASGERDPEMLYNSACCLAQLGRGEEAEEALLDCVRAGFRDFDHMESDEDLEPIRGSTTYEAIMEARTRVRDDTGRDVARPAAPVRRAPVRIDPVAQWRADHPEGYTYDTDEERGITYATFLEPSAQERMKSMLAELEAHLRRAYFGKAPQGPLLVAIVRPKDATRYLERPEVKGMYLHPARRLVARDTGQSLQHEFVHLAHFAHMERLGQRHPMWVQEGLASLYEDYLIRADGTIEFLPNIRFNLARRAVRAGAAVDWKDLFAMSGEEFMKDAEKHYPQVRAMFEFFAAKSKLEEFYAALVATSGSSPDGTAAVERAFGDPLAKVEARWRTWMSERGVVDDKVSHGDASLGLTADDAGDGVKVRSFVANSAAKAAGIRLGDVIFSIDGTPVRNRDELLLAVARLTLGRAIEVRFRRDGQELAVTLEPRPLGR